MNRNRSMRMPDPDLDEITTTMETNREGGDYFLDTATGEVVYIPLELQSAAEADEGRSIGGLAEWERELLPIAEAIHERADPRWARIPEVPAREIYEQMEGFAQTVTDERLRELLGVALDGPGAFRRFKDVLAWFPQEQGRWYQVKQAYLERRAREWLEELGKNA